MTDIFFAVKINEAAKRAGVGFVMAKTQESALNNIRNGAEVVIVDLNCRELDTVGIIQAIKSDESLKGVRVVAFLSHVFEDLRRAAVQAGCDEVMPRSRFVTAIETMFERPAATAHGEGV